MEDLHYEVAYQYYNYNTGAGDNGTRDYTHKCKSEEEAKKLVEQINADAKAYREDRYSDASNLSERWYGRAYGFFVGEAHAYEVKKIVRTV